MYSNRDQRAEYCVQTYGDFIKGKVLDVGCWEKDLKKYLATDIDYTGIDIAGNYDIQVDLEKGVLPFGDNEFDCVICTDVLEHIDSMHSVFQEIIRVTKKYAIISLPNNWVPFKKDLLSGTGTNKYYGLPITKPEDRHKWFFNFEEAETFFRKRQTLDGYVVESCKAYPELSMLKKKKMIKSVLKKIMGTRVYNNLFSSTIWVVLSKVDEYGKKQ